MARTVGRPRRWCAERHGYSSFARSVVGLWQHAGRYGIDYQSQEYERLQVEAETALRERLVELVTAGRKVVVDFSFWRRARRDQYKALVQNAGGTWRLIYLKPIQTKYAGASTSELHGSTPMPPSPSPSRYLSSTWQASKNRSTKARK